ncbi:MAG TPA: hypothetical protein VEY30_07175, partial [Myxococcaceae bacterium]|nr:hypothetical protein [Myxococcaceae bacterium]
PLARTTALDQLTPGCGREFFFSGAAAQAVPSAASPAIHQRFINTLRRSLSMKARRAVVNAGHPTQCVTS